MSGTVLDRTGWASGPDTRGTLDILWGAFATLGLCVWTAVHPNIQLRQNWKRDLSTRLWMMVVAVIFPEVIISAAWHQRVSAQELTSKKTTWTWSLRRKDTASNENLTGAVPESKSDDTAWTREQAFFVVMGGFAFQHSHSSSSDENESLRSILTVEGFKLMRKAEYAPKLTESDVEERSNADVIAKFIVITQVLWFAVQVLGRLFAKIAITALEVHTIVHVGCAIIMYILWWDKPYALMRSVTLETENEKKIGDLFLFHDTLSQKHQTSVRLHELRRRKYWEDRAINESKTLDEQGLPPADPVMPSIEDALAIYGAEDFEIQYEDKHAELLKSLAPSADAGLQCLLNRDPHIVSILEQPEWRGVRQTSDNFTLRQVWGSWTVDKGHNMSIAKLMHFLFNLIYGGGHLAAWNSSTFPTTIEADLWRASAIVVASLFVYGSVWVLFWMSARSRSKWLLPVRRGDLNIVMGPFFSTVIAAYFCARCYFFVESLISLRSLPVSAYETVQWSSFLPHAG